MNMMEMVFSSPNDSFDRKIWPKVYAWFFSYISYFYWELQLAIRTKTDHYITLSNDFTPLGLCVCDSKHLPFHGKLDTTITTEIAYNLYSSQMHLAGIAKTGGQWYAKRASSVGQWVCCSIQNWLFETDCAFHFLLCFLIEEWSWQVIELFLCHSFLIWKMGIRIPHTIVVKVKCIKTRRALITVLGRKQAFNEW